MSRNYGADDTWPLHKKAHWRPVLAQARAAGWVLTHVDAPHTFGYVTCPAGVHSFKVDSTASGAQFFAVEASKIITKKCRHGTASTAGKVAERVEHGTALLDRVDEILAGAEADIERAEAYQGAWAIVDDLDALAAKLRMQLDTASLTLDEIVRDDEAVTTELERVEAELYAELALAESVAEPVGTDLIDAALAEARGTLDQAEDVAVQLRRQPSKAKHVMGRVEAARARIGRLEARLITVQERFGPADG